MYQITKEFELNGGDHVIHGLPAGHKCGKRHGHNWIIVMVLESEELDKSGFVRDFGDLKPVKEYINVLDHQFLNEFFEPTTCEGIAKHFYDRFKDEFPELAAVRVSETPKTWAEYREGFPGTLETTVDHFERKLDQWEENKRLNGTWE